MKDFLNALKGVILAIIKSIALRLLLFYENHVDVTSKSYIRDAKAEYLYCKRYVDNFEKLSRELNNGK